MVCACDPAFARVTRSRSPSVALITGEEKILPPHARWFLCTTESMPIGGGVIAGADNKKPREFAFVGLDEAQLGADLERGHVFTDRLLRARGREETMILGSSALRRITNVGNRSTSGSPNWPTP